MTIKELINKLGFSKEGTFTNKKTYVIDINDSKEFSKVYSLLDKSSDVEEVDESNLLTVHNSSTLFLTDEYQLNLLADFDHDSYKLVIIKSEGEE